MNGVLVLAGPTASGKTALALELAERFGAEIVGADARQIYRGMPIGTAAPTKEERELVPHHLVGFLDPLERYSAARFVADALHAIEAIHLRGRRALVVGGTGFYLRALCGDVRLGGVRDERARERLARETLAHPPEVLHAWLAARHPARANELARNDTYRVLRALEMTFVREPGDELARDDLRARGIPFAKVALTIDADERDARIAARVDAMVAGGLLEEARRIGRDAVAADAVGYPQALAYLDGWSSMSELRRSLVQATRRYAKRQRTWLRSEANVTWIDRALGMESLLVLARESLGWI